MPARQRGWAEKDSRGPRRWHACWRDENGRRRKKSPFPTKTAAEEYANQQADRIEAVKRGDVVRLETDARTSEEISALFLELYPMDESTRRRRRSELRQFNKVHGALTPDELTKVTLTRFRSQLSPGAQYNVLRTVKQMLAWAVEYDLATRNAAVGIKNPKRKREERLPIVPFENWGEIDAIEAEIDECYIGLPTFAIGTGLRPEEWAALERKDVDRRLGIVTVNKRFTDGVLKPGCKTEPSRVVPLRKRVVAALDRRPKRIDSPLLFPAPEGGYTHLSNFRDTYWYGALAGAGLELRGPKNMRHTFATWAITAGEPELVVLAKIMGTSVQMIEDTYFRWTKKSDERIRAALDAWDARDARDAREG